MLNVKTPDEALAIIRSEFSKDIKKEFVPLKNALGRTAADDVVSTEFVPDFDRSTVDGYAVKASDTFGCSEALPAVLNNIADIKMGDDTDIKIKDGECASVPTGGELPDGADSVVMLEYSEDYGDGTVGILKPSAPGNGVIFRGDDIRPGGVVIKRGKKLTPADIGALASLGITEIAVSKKPKVGIISTGNELVKTSEKPKGGEIRDVNSDLLYALVESFGAVPVSFGIVRDDENEIRKVLEEAVNECDAVLISGGSSVGEKDMSCKLIGEIGKLLFHGLLMKPGKPTILGNAGGKPVFGLPGHPAAAFFVTEIFVRAALSVLTGEETNRYGIKAILDENVSSNHGRAEFIAVKLYQKDGKLFAHPLRSKSGLISTLSRADGFFEIDALTEGVSSNDEIMVTAV
ncbi:MAG: molybdopterin molybdotransferase MoeA [Clostridiales bacterium]|nr:molybdopterin molybdotransferase MoeA [Clostridiales bacterium]